MAVVVGVAGKTSAGGRAVRVHRLDPMWHTWSALPLLRVRFAKLFGFFVKGPFLYRPDPHDNYDTTCSVHGIAYLSSWGQQKKQYVRNLVQDRQVFQPLWSTVSTLSMAESLMHGGVGS
jgi:hypothetical protein